LSCFNIAGDWHYKEIQRVKSPKGLLEAILVEGNAGAASTLSYSVYLVQAGTLFNEKSKQFSKDAALFLADHQEELKVEWKNDGFLNISYRKARIYQFSNFWWSECCGYIELRLIPLDDNSSLIEKGNIKIVLPLQQSNQAVQRTRTASAVHDYPPTGTTAVPASADGKR
jgi:hypothetical protein